MESSVGSRVKYLVEAVAGGEIEGGVRFVHGDVREAADLFAIESVDAVIECSAEPSAQAAPQTPSRPKLPIPPGLPRYALDWVREAGVPKRALGVNPYPTKCHMAGALSTP